MNLPRHRHAGPIGSAVLSPDGKYRLTASWDQTARIWDAATGQEVRTLIGHTDSCLVGGLQSGRHAPGHRQ